MSAPSTPSNAFGIDMLQGSIVRTLIKLALPVMATAFMTLTYNLVDLMWIGRLGAGAVAGVGAASFFIWLCDGILVLARIGGQVLTGQHIGADSIPKARAHAAASSQLAAALAIIYGGVIIMIAPQLIGFFNLIEPGTNAMGIEYLRIIAAGFVFYNLNRTLSSLSIAAGDSRLPLIINAVGVVSNMVLDPLFIFTFNLGVGGAAWATILSQAIVTSLLIWRLAGKTFFARLPIATLHPLGYYGHIIRIGLPQFIQSVSFIFISIYIGRLVASFGQEVVAAQRIGAQVESISWMIADAFGIAVSAFVAQNYGARNLQRAKQGYYTSMAIMTVLGLANTAILYYGGEFAFTLFIDDPKVIIEGTYYLQILSFSQLAICLDAVVRMTYTGFGHTVVPSSVSAVFFLSRIPLALYLITTPLGVKGIWWALTITSFCIALLIMGTFSVFLRKMMRQHQAPEPSNSPENPAS